MDLDMRRLPPLELAELTHVNLIAANLSSAWLNNAKLRRAILIGADLAGTVLDDADLSGTIFSGGGTGAKGLTQPQLDPARCDPKNPPQLDGLVDPLTGEPLRPPSRPPL